MVLEKAVPGLGSRIAARACCWASWKGFATAPTAKACAFLPPFFFRFWGLLAFWGLPAFSGLLAGRMAVLGLRGAALCNLGHRIFSGTG